jgi:hypothetical protein
VMLGEIPFRQFVESAIETLGVSLDSNPGAIRKTIEELTGVWPASPDNWYETIRSILFFSKGNQIFRQDLSDLRDQLVLRYIVDSEPLLPYFEVLQCIRDAVRECKFLKSSEDSQAWEQACLFALAFNRLNPTVYGFDPVTKLQSQYSRLAAVGRNAVTLRARGVEVSVHNGILELDKQDLKRLTRELEEILLELGFEDALFQLFGNLQKQYDGEQRRYHLALRPRSFGLSAPMVPWGLLYQLMVKHVCCKKKQSRNSANSWRRLIKESIELSVVYDCQPHTTFEQMFFTPQNVARYLREMAVFDTIFTVPQMSPDTLLLFLRNLFDWADRDMALAQMGFTAEHVADLAQYLFACAARSPHLPIIVEKKTLLRQFNSWDSTVIDSLLSCLSFPAPGPNQNFTIPNDHGNINSWDRPFIEIGPSKFLLANILTCSPGFFEAVLTAYRAAIPDTDMNVGDTAEMLLSGECQDRCRLNSN